MTKEEMKKKVEELEETKAQMMGNINFVNGQISLLKEMIEPPKEMQNGSPKKSDKVSKETSEVA